MNAHVPVPRVVVVVVAYNRRELLLECLAALTAQTREPDLILVVDNASSDGTAVAVAAKFPAVAVTRLDRNTGGAGGFTVGIAEAVHRHDADLVWLMDDDTIPTPTALSELLTAREAAPHSTRILASAVTWTDGRDHPMNTPRVRPLATRASVVSAARFGCYPVRSASFVALLIDARAVREHGLPVADYFLWNDDFEYTARILRRSTGYLVTRSVVVHKTKVFGSTNIDPGPRFRLEVRNKIWLLSASGALSPLERITYTVASLRRWASTFRASTDTATLRRGLWDGLREGLGSRPRTNDVTLVGFGEATEAVVAVESAVAPTSGQRP